MANPDKTFSASFRLKRSRARGISISLTLLACTLLAPADAAYGATPKSAASIDVGTGNAAFGRSNGPFPPINLAFPAEDRIAVVSLDGITHATQTAVDDTHLHLTVDFLRVSHDEIAKDGSLQFETNSDNSGVVFLPSGRFIVNDGRELMLYDRNRALLKKKPIEEVCQRSLSKLALLSAILTPGSENVTLLNVHEDYGERWGKPTKMQEYLRSLREAKEAGRPLPPLPSKQDRQIRWDICWFSTDTLELLSRTGAAPYGDYKPKRDEVTGPWRWIVAPQSKNGVDFPCDPPHNDFSADDPFILHARDGMARVCFTGEVSVKLDGHVVTKKLKKKDWNASVAGDALNAPILAVFQSYLHAGPFHIGKLETQIEVFNYEDMKTLTVLTSSSPSPQSNPNLLIIGSKEKMTYPFKVAIAPDGDKAAVLDGPLLYLYSLSREGEPGKGQNEKSSK